MNAPSVSVILACRNEAESIERCLESVLGQEDPGGGIEFLVADGLSSDGTMEILQKIAARDPRLKVLANPGKIVSTGLNEAIRQARGAVIVRMDAHTTYAPDYVRASLEVLRETGADNVGGPARTEARSKAEQAFCAAYHSPFSVGGARFHDVHYEGYVDTVPYGCWRAEAFKRFGLFDPELARNQDDEMNLRIVRQGGKVWQSPRIRSWYSPRTSLGALFRQYMQYGYWKVRVIQKHHLPASIRHLVPGLFVGALATLLCLAPFVVWARWAFSFLFGFYLLCLLAASCKTAATSSWQFFPLFPAIFACYHFGYGYGFLRGLFDFMVMRRGSGRVFSDLTRPIRAVPTHPAEQK